MFFDCFEDLAFLSRFCFFPVRLAAEFPQVSLLVWLCFLLDVFVGLFVCLLQLISSCLFIRICQLNKYFIWVLLDLPSTSLFWIWVTDRDIVFYSKPLSSFKADYSPFQFIWVRLIIFIWIWFLEFKRYLFRPLCLYLSFVVWLERSLIQLKTGTTWLLQIYL